MTEQEEASASPMKPFNLRVSEDLLALIDRATELSEFPDRAKWGREALEAGARAEIAAATKSQGRTPADVGSTTQPPSRSAVRGVHRRFHEPVSTPRCVHPLTARVQTPEAEVCGLCSTVTRWRL